MIPEIMVSAGRDLSDFIWGGGEEGEYYDELKFAWWIITKSVHDKMCQRSNEHGSVGCSRTDYVHSEMKCRCHSSA